MRLFTGILLLLTFTSTFAQESALTSAVYTWPDMTSVSQKRLLKGPTTYFKSYEVNVLTFKPGSKSLRGYTPNDVEELLIIKQGKLRVTLNKVNKVLGPGSVAFIMPGEKYTVQQEGGEESVFFSLKSTAKSPDVRERGKSNGGSFLLDSDGIVTKKTERGGRKDFFDRPTATCDDFEMHVTILNEGLPSHPPHTHAQEEIILLMKGDATMSINSKDYETPTGSLVFLASGDLHGIRNTGKGQCEYFAFQWK
jgi:(S)-ureidoglycine aminohydrolase